MYNYQALNILSEVVRSKGFSKAAIKLRLTQPAVTSRIRLLEDEVGKPLINRTTPPTLTDFGQKLIRHYNRVKKLEEEFDGELRERLEKNKLTIGINADSVATWFFPVVRETIVSLDCLIDLIVENETYTHELLRKGEVTGCVTTKSQPLPGCESEHLLTIGYPCIASKDFAARYFKSGMTAENFSRAPTAIFDGNDFYPYEFLRRIFGRKTPQFLHHTVPSSEGYFKIITSGLAYGLVPIFQAREMLNTKELVELFPEKRMQVKLYWQYPYRRSVLMKRFSDLFVSSARSLKL